MVISAIQGEAESWAPCTLWSYSRVCTWILTSQLLLNSHPFLIIINWIVNYYYLVVNVINNHP